MPKADDIRQAVERVRHAFAVRKCVVVTSLNQNSGIKADDILALCDFAASHAAEPAPDCTCAPLPEPPNDDCPTHGEDAEPAPELVEVARKACCGSVCASLKYCSVDRVLAALRQAGALAGWSDIASAPKDGTPVLLARHDPTFGWVRGWGTYERALGIEGWIARGFFHPPRRTRIGGTDALDADPVSRRRSPGRDRWWCRWMICGGRLSWPVASKAI